MQTQELLLPNNMVRHLAGSSASWTSQRRKGVPVGLSELEIMTPEVTSCMESNIAADWVRRKDGVWGLDLNL